MRAPEDAVLITKDILFKINKNKDALLFKTKLSVSKDPSPKQKPYSRAKNYYLPGAPTRKFDLVLLVKTRFPFFSRMNSTVGNDLMVERKTCFVLKGTGSCSLNTQLAFHVDICTGSCILPVVPE